MSEITPAEQIRLTIIKKVNYDTAAADLPPRLDTTLS